MLRSVAGRLVRLDVLQEDVQESPRSCSNGQNIPLLERDPDPESMVGCSKWSDSRAGRMEGVVICILGYRIMCYLC